PNLYHLQTLIANNYLDTESFEDPQQVHARPPPRILATPLVRETPEHNPHLPRILLQLPESLQQPLHRMLGHSIVQHLRGRDHPQRKTCLLRPVDQVEWILRNTMPADPRPRIVSHEPESLHRPRTY